MMRWIGTLLRGGMLALLLFAVLAVAEAASSPWVATLPHHQTVCRRKVRDIGVSVWNPTFESMNVSVDALHVVDQPEADGSVFVTFSEMTFLLGPREGRVVAATLTIPKNARPTEHAALLRFTNVTGDAVQAAVGVWLRFDVLPWRVGTPRCEAQR